MPDEEWLAMSFAGKPMTMGGAGIVGPIDEYMRFARMLLNEGELDGVRILEPATVRLMATDHLDPRIPGRPLVAGRQRRGRLRLRLLRPHPPSRKRLRRTAARSASSSGTAGPRRCSGSIR